MSTLAEVKPIYESNSRDVISTLRFIADSLEKGEYGEVISAALVLRLSDYQVEAFGLGLGDIDTSVTLLEQAKTKLIRVLDQGS
jgi:hypothetical protein